MFDEGNFNNEKIKKVNFNQFINEKIINNSNKEKEINKNDLIKQIKEKVYNGSNYINEINSYFKSKNLIKISELQNFLDQKNKNIPNNFSERIIITNKINFQDLDFLTKDLPEDKNRKKILKPRYISPNSQNQKNKNLIDSNDLIKELEKLNLPKENTIIKPKNGITDVLNRKKYQNKKSFSPILQERVKSKFSSYNNLVQPMNKNKKVQINIFDPISIGIENLKYKITHKKSDSKSFFTNANSKDEDYFFNLYKDYSNQNQSLKILNKKVYKISQFENEKKNNFVSFSKKNILSSSINNNDLKSNLLNKIGKAQKKIHISKEENLNDLELKNINNQNSQKILFDIKNEINKLSEGFNDPNKNVNKLSHRIKSLYKLNTEFNDNKNVIDKKSNNDFIQIPINDDNKNINYEFGLQYGNILNDLI